MSNWPTSKVNRLLILVLILTVHGNLEPLSVPSKPAFKLPIASSVINVWSEYGDPEFTSDVIFRPVFSNILTPPILGPV